MEEGDWPLELRCDVFREVLPTLIWRGALERWLADPRCVRLRRKLRMSPEHRELWQAIEDEIGAALAWAAPEDDHPKPRAGEEKAT